jgi:hypothetical protein
MSVRNRKVAVKQRSTAPTAAVVLRRQAIEDEHHFNDAVRMLLSEWVRQHLNQRGEEHESSE